MKTQKILLVLLSIVGMAVASFAQTWTGAAGTMNWSDVGNWSSDELPMINTDVKINGLSSVETPVVFDMEEASIKALTVGETLDAALELSSGGLLYMRGGLALGKSAEGTLTIIDGKIVYTNGATLAIASGASGVGRLIIKQAGVLKSSSTGVMQIGNGVNSYGEVINYGILSTLRNINVGHAEGSTGAFWHCSGVVTSGYDFVIGNAGTGEANVEATMRTRSCYIGAGASGQGVLRLTGLLILDNGNSVCVGCNGIGVLEIAGGEVSIAGNAPSISLCTNDLASTYGRIQGWGKFSSPTACLQNSGLVIADGGGVKEDLDFSIFVGSVSKLSLENRYNNTTTNGWYAINKGRLLLPVNGTVTVARPSYCWGEDATNATVDLVNSVRMEFDGITATTKVQGELLAIDRDDVPVYVAGGLISVWHMMADKDFAGVELQVRYDHVAVGRNGLRLLRYDEAAGVWMNMPAAIDEGYILRSTSPWAPLGNDRIGLFAVASYLSPTTLLLN